jgi:DNA-binding CsgD family transcriptional regulator
MKTIQTLKRVLALTDGCKRHVERKAGLSLREQQLCCLFALGYSRKEIPDLVHISIKTVNHHRARIIEVNHGNPETLAFFAVKNELISIDEWLTSPYIPLHKLPKDLSQTGTEHS